MSHADSPLLHLCHTTRYRYASRVDIAHHVLHLQPRNMPSQKVQRFTLTIDPEPANCRASFDYFGNRQHHMSLQGPHQALQVISHSIVELTPRFAQLEEDSSPAWESVRDGLLYHAGAAYPAHGEFSLPSHFVPTHDEFRRYALQAFTPQQSLLGGAIRLMAQMYQDFCYATASTDINTPALEAFRVRRGVCQDFAHIMLACLRSIGLAARYVSGYLLTEPPPGQPRLLGADASHAWVSVYCPHHGWVELDPTNNLIPDSKHVVIGYGRDYADVPPLRGVIHGGGAHTLEVEVSVVPAHDSLAQHLAAHHAIITGNLA